MTRNTITILIYHHHRLSDLTQFKTSIFSEHVTMNTTKFPDTLIKTDPDAIIIEPV
jgi:hypothetical protein